MPAPERVSPGEPLQPPVIVHPVFVHPHLPLARWWSKPPAGATLEQDDGIERSLARLDSETHFRSRSTGGSLPGTIVEMAWTSPIWYRPEKTIPAE